MTVDDENSIYVGGLPYDVTEDSIRHVFSLYGHVVAVKIINDQKIRGKCYGFVTFTNPRSAENAITDMNGRTIGGRVVRVNEVQTRGGRPGFDRDNFRRDGGRDGDWDRGRERERSFNRDRERYQDRDDYRSREHDRDRERDYEHGHDFDLESDRALDRGREHAEFDQEHTQDRDREWDRARDMDWDNDRDMEKSRGYDSDRDNEKETRRRRRHSGGRLKSRDSRELSSSSSDGYRDHVKEQLDKAIQKHDDLLKEVDKVKEKVEEKTQLISDLQKKSQKLEDSLAAAQKVSSERRAMLNKLQRCVLQVRDYSEKVKNSEKEYQSLIDATMADVEMGDDAATRDGSALANGQVLG